MAINRVPIGKEAGPNGPKVGLGGRAPRTLAWILLVAVVLSGCASEGSEGSEPSGTSTPAPTASPSPTLPATAKPSPTGSVEPSVEATASPEPTPTVVERWGLEWEDLESMAFELDGEAIRLDGGKAVVARNGDSQDGEPSETYDLQNRVSQGDLDGDGHDDLVAHLIVDSARWESTHLLVPLIDDGQGGRTLQPFRLGDRVIVEEIEVRDGSVEVSLLDRDPEDPSDIITQRRVLDIDFSTPEPTASVTNSEPLLDLPLPGPESPEVDVRFDPGTVGAIVAGTLEFRGRQTYSVHMSEGQTFTATLDAPVGIWLDMRLDDHVVAPASERSQLVHADLPATGSWKVTVVSAHTNEDDYRLSLEALPSDPADPDPTPTPTPTGTAEPTPEPTPTDDSPVMYLTFDDGPHPVYTPKVLDVLARHDIRATFFVVGTLAVKYPEIIERIFEEGHQVGNHTWNHENLAGLPREAFDETVSRTQELLGPRAASCLRPPYASMDAFTHDWAHEHGLDIALWNVDPEDWRRPSPLTIAQHIVDHARDGAIILLHDGDGDRSRTVLGLDVALSELSTHGYRYELLC